MMFAFVLLAGQSIQAAIPLEDLTTQRSYPIPYSYLENLYFHNGSFYCLGDQLVKKELSFAMDNAREIYFRTWVVPPRKSKVTTLTGITLVLCDIHSSYLGHFFHLSEHLVGIWSYFGFSHSDEVNTIILAGDGGGKGIDWKGPNQINEHLLKALFPNAQVLTYPEIVKMSHRNQVIHMERVFVSDRARTRDSLQCTKINKFLGAALPSLSNIALNSYAKKVWNYAGVCKEKREGIRVTYTKRSPPRTFSKKVEAKMLKAIAALPGVTVDTVDFAKISFQEQIQVIANTDILLGVHGNGLTHLLFLPEHAAVIEVFPPNASALDYRLLADARKLSYLGLVPEYGVLSRELAYQIGPVGDVSIGIDTLDFLDPLLDFISSYINL